METVDDEPALVIRTCDGPGRGRFKVTVCDVLEVPPWHGRVEVDNG